MFSKEFPSLAFFVFLHFSLSHNAAAESPNCQSMNSGLNDSAVHSMGDCLAWGQQQEAARKDRDQDLGNQSANKARKAAALGDQLGRDRDQLGSTLRAFDSDRPENFSRKAEILDRPYLPPKEFREPVKALGLSSMRDLWEKGPEVQRNLFDQANRDAETATRSYEQAAQDLAKQQKMSSMKEKVRRNLSMMGSAAPKISTRPNSISEPEHSNARENGAKRTDLEAVKAGRSLASISERSKEQNARIAPEEGDTRAPTFETALASKQRGVLADRLRLAEKLKKALEEKSAGPALRSGHALDAEPPSEQATASPGASALMAVLESPAPRFSLAGPETDQAVERIVQGGSRAGLSNRSLPSESASLFERIRSSLRHCLENACVLAH